MKVYRRAHTTVLQHINLTGDYIYRQRDRVPPGHWHPYEFYTEPCSQLATINALGAPDTGIAMSSDQIYPHIRVVLSIILGLGITTLLNGVASVIEHPRRYGWSWIHMTWAAWALLSIVTFWWWEFRLVEVPTWTFGSYVFVIFYCATYFMVSTLLFPRDVSEYGSYENYLIQRRKWFFGLITLITLLDLVDTSLKGVSRWHMLGSAYPAHTVLMLGIAALGAWRSSRRVQMGIAFFALAYQVAYFAMEYLTLSPD
jgi:hypothetical protein